MIFPLFINLGCGWEIRKSWRNASFSPFDGSTDLVNRSSQLDVTGLAIKVNDLVLRVARRLRRTQLRQPARVGSRYSRGRGRVAVHAHRKAVCVAVAPERADGERNIINKLAKLGGYHFLLTQPNNHKADSLGSGIT